jgi:HSP20 family protein
MNRTSLNPFFTGRPLSGMLDDVFNRSISDLMGADSTATIPSVNISENAESFILELAAPGLEKNDFSIEVNQGQLVISGTRENKNEEKESGTWTRKEFSYHSFKRSFNLSESVEVNRIEASYEHGILKVTLPRKEEAKDKGPLQIAVS